MANNGPVVKLNNGYDFPLIGCGTFKGENTYDDVYESTKLALKVGYRHIDTAYYYNSEEAVGRAIKDSGIPREEIFVTTKLFETFHEPQHVKPVVELSLKYLQLNHVDLLLMHWPFARKFNGYDISHDSDQSNSASGPNVNENENHSHEKESDLIDVPIIDTWRAMEKLVDEGLVKSIGVSNFTIPLLDDLLLKARILPVVNQIEIHPYFPQQELVDYSKKKNIILTAYSPLLNPFFTRAFGLNLDIYNDSTILQLAKKYGKLPSQVILNWGLNRGYAVIPKACKEEHIRANLDYFTMDDEDIEAITNMKKGEYVRVIEPTILFGPEFKLF